MSYSVDIILLYNYLNTEEDIIYNNSIILYLVFYYWTTKYCFFVENLSFLWFMEIYWYIGVYLHYLTIYKCTIYDFMIIIIVCVCVYNIIRCSNYIF